MYSVGPLEKNGGWGCRRQFLFFFIDSVRDVSCFDKELLIFCAIELFFVA
jgi:hypothetical protein